MPKNTGKKLADMLYGDNPERAAFGVYPQMTGKRSKQDREAAKSFPVDLARGVVAGAVGMPGDIESLIRMLPGLDETTILPTSEDVLKRIPFGTNTPVGQFASGLGALAGGSAPTGPLVRGVKAVPQAVRQGALNLAAPRTLNPQAGAIVFHGSPHRFDKFSSKKIGTGEGAQAYGHGLYFAESPEVAKTYQPRSPKFEQKLVNLYQKASSKSDYPMMEVLEDAMLHRTPNEIVEKFTNADDGYSGQHAKAAQDFVKWYSKNEPEVGGLYTVDLPDEKIAQMLDYDKPLSAQSPEVKRVLMEHPDVLDYIAKAEAQRVNLNEMSPVRLEKIPSASAPYDESRMAGKDVMTAIAQRSGLGKAQGAIEEELRQLGIPGIRYLDEQSRGTTGTGKWKIKLPEGEERIYNFKPNDDALELMKATAEPYGSSNYVVFPGEEDALTIVDRKKDGGPVHFSDNPDVMQLELAGGGIVSKLAKMARAPAKTKAEIEALAERLAPQVTGEYVRKDAKSAKTVADKTQKQFQREKTLPVDVRPTAEVRTPQPVDIEKLKGEVMIGVPGDPTLTGKTLYSVGDVKLGSPSPQHGGPQYGLYNDEGNFWASGIGAARRVQNLAREAGQHPTYSHDIPGQFIGESKYPMPYELSFPDTLKTIREDPKQAPHEFGSLKMVGPRQIIDQQMIDEIRAYEERMKQLTGKKAGGAVRKAEGGEITADDLILEERKL